MMPQERPHHRYCTKRNRVYNDRYDVTLALSRYKQQIVRSRCGMYINRGKCFTGALVNIINLGRMWLLLSKYMKDEKCNGMVKK